MAREMILDGKLAPASYEFLSEWPDGDPGDRAAIPLELWLARHAEGNTPDGVGVILEGDDDLTPLKPLLGHIPFVSLHLPKFTDGRIYSHASRLRRLWGYPGTIVVHGDVLRDQLIYLSRSGVNGFYMREDQDVKTCLAAFSLFTEYYQYD
jgi:uncharacterized protein (DUF934 family)